MEFRDGFVGSIGNTPLIKLRQKASKGKLILVEGA
jgi:hypothetical protein